MVGLKRKLHFKVILKEKFIFLVGFEEETAFSFSFEEKFIFLGGNCLFVLIKKKIIFS